MTELSDELKEALKENLEDKKESLKNLEEQLKLLNPHSVLSRGYSISLDKNGKPIKSIKNIQKDDEVITLLGDGKIRSKVVDLLGEEK